mmetsp:Transcript_6550/g.11467  ORF Transcript_6550/g.11467 Transcript_6550/m.11467 type:complete len:416 (-) Transcript_6550:145-1392(-)
MDGAVRLGILNVVTLLGRVPPPGSVGHELQTAHLLLGGPLLTGVPDSGPDGGGVRLGGRDAVDVDVAGEGDGEARTLPSSFAVGVLGVDRLGGDGVGGGRPRRHVRALRLVEAVYRLVESDRGEGRVGGVVRRVLGCRRLAACSLRGGGGVVLGVAHLLEPLDHLQFRRRHVARARLRRRRVGPSQCRRRGRLLCLRPAARPLEHEVQPLEAVELGALLVAHAARELDGFRPGPPRASEQVQRVRLDARGEGSRETLSPAAGSRAGAALAAALGRAAAAAQSRDSTLVVVPSLGRAGGVEVVRDEAAAVLPLHRPPVLLLPLLPVREAEASRFRPLVGGLAILRWRRGGRRGRWSRGRRRRRRGGRGRQGAGGRLFREAASLRGPRRRRFGRARGRGVLGVRSRTADHLDGGSRL